MAISYVFVAIMSCTQTQRSTMTGAFKACAEGDLGALVKPGITVFDDVVNKIKGNSPTLEADLTSLATTFGLNTIECAIAAVEAVLMAPTSNGSAVATAAQETPPGLARARVWEATQHLHAQKAPAK